MAIRIKSNADPFSAKARADPLGFGLPDTTDPILAPSAASRVLWNEMRRYCEGEVKGRSFLIAGHRGSGKTTMVDDVVLDFKRRASSGSAMKPLPVYLLGPVLLEDPKADDDGEADATPHPAPAPRPREADLSVSVKVAPEKTPVEEEKLMIKVLIQVVLALHQAVSTEFTERFRRLALLESAASRDGSRAQELRELAARFAIELVEGPPPARLQQFWEVADAAHAGVLFDEAPFPDQGMRELVALTGVTHAHQRISGRLLEQQEDKTGRSKSTEASMGVGTNVSELLKPLTAVLAGAAVAAGSAVGNASSGKAALLGVLTAMAAGTFLRFTSTSTSKRERKIDRTFIPDFSVRTLNRLIPALLDRLKAAGLAPVFIVDELDKVDNLSKRIYPLIRNLKKLFAESSFTCLLVDRGFYENLLIREQLEQNPDETHKVLNGGDPIRQAAHGRNFSYFSHRLFVAFEPADLHAYLANLLEVVDD